MKEIDCRGLPCPQPVILTKQALEDMTAGSLTVIVDNEASKGNVIRFAESRGHKILVNEQGGETRIVIEKTFRIHSSQEKPREVLTCGEGERKGKSVVVLRSDQLGVGEPELGRVLVRAFLKTLGEIDWRPNTIILYNRGVYLAADDSEVLETLKELAEEGIEILVCGTCLDYYKLKERLSVGTISNMYAILDNMATADKIISP